MNSAVVLGCTGIVLGLLILRYAIRSIRTRLPILSLGVFVVLLGVLLIFAPGAAAVNLLALAIFGIVLSVLWITRNAIPVDSDDSDYEDVL
jgi:uncharacterized membrane protein HdeD (DUF308 family)